ncbi:MAG TPA: hypothetical protein VHO06_17460 [Polyangia bacterium]|nr:hypothetical protein [Polyangia bacterium]
MLEKGPTARVAVPTRQAGGPGYAGARQGVTLAGAVPMPRLPLVLLVALSACTLGTAPPPAGPPPPPGVAGHPDMAGWRLMGDAWVAGQFAREIVHVGKSEGRTARVTLVVTESSLEVGDVVLEFGNGQRWSPGLRHAFADGSRSRSIDLPNHVRFIRGVELARGSVPPGARAHVEIWGQ